MKNIITEQGRELLFFGDFVAVAWNVEENIVKKSTPNGFQTTTTYKRTDYPYIDFVTMWDETNEDEDSPVRGGIDIKFAEKLIKELQLAINYLKESNVQQ